MLPEPAEAACSAWRTEVNEKHQQHTAPTAKGRDLDGYVQWQLSLVNLLVPFDDGIFKKENSRGIIISSIHFRNQSKSLSIPRLHHQGLCQDCNLHPFSLTKDSEQIAQILFPHCNLERKKK